MQIGPALLRRVVALVLVVPLFAASAMRAYAQNPGAVTAEGYITAVHLPDGFSLDGRQIILVPNTTFGLQGGKKPSTDDAVKSKLETGDYVWVTGQSSHSSIVATTVLLRDDSQHKVTGFGVIDRMLTTGSQPVFRADGYVFRLDAKTNMEFSRTLKGLNQVGTNVWIQYKGFQEDRGDVLLTWVSFIKPKLRAPKANQRAPEAQMAAFPAGSIIDFDGSYRTDGDDHNRHKIADQGGACGWYPLSRDAALQERVRRVGARVIPQYQREMPGNDPSKVPFRFYVVEEKNIHSDLGCGNDGLVLIAADAAARMQNDDQLVALLADQVAARLLARRPRSLQASEWVEGSAQSAAAAAAGGLVAGSIAGTIVNHEMQRKLVEERGRMALGYLADAGYDPWQAPEAWRLLAPSRFPKDPSKLKYPSRSKNELTILNFEYKRPAGAAQASN